MSESNWWWLSFVDHDKPEGNKFLGVVIIEGETIIDAVRHAWDLNINPGGEVLAGQLEMIDTIPPEFRERLLSKEDAETLAQSAR